MMNVPHVRGGSPQLYKLMTKKLKGTFREIPGAGNEIPEHRPAIANQWWDGFFVRFIPLCFVKNHSF